MANFLGASQFYLIQSMCMQSFVCISFIEKNLSLVAYSKSVKRIELKISIEFSCFFQKCNRRIFPCMQASNDVWILFHEKQIKPQQSICTCAKGIGLPSLSKEPTTRCSCTLYWKNITQIQLIMKRFVYKINLVQSKRFYVNENKLFAIFLTVWLQMCWYNFNLAVGSLKVRVALSQSV